MLGLMSLREGYDAIQPLSVAHIAGCFNVTTQTDVLIETTVELGIV